MKTLCTLSLLLLGSAAQAAGFSASDLGSAAGQINNDRAEISREAEALRLSLAYDLGAGLSARTEAERNTLLAVLHTGEGAADLRIKWFMAGAIGQTVSDKTTLLYNPLARGTLALDWNKTAEGWRVTHAWLSSSGPAQWPAKNLPWRKAFVEDYPAARNFPGDAGPDWITFESNRWLGALAVWLESPANAKAANSARQLITDGRTAKAGGDNIDVIPERARRTYSPIAAISRKDGGAALIFGSAVTPHLLITADFAANARLEKLSLMNLGNAGVGQ
jgi:hypothetical protein